MPVYFHSFPPVSFALKAPLSFPLRGTVDHTTAGRSSESVRFGTLSVWLLGSTLGGLGALDPAGAGGMVTLCGLWLPNISPFRRSV